MDLETFQTAVSGQIKQGNTPQQEFLVNHLRHDTCREWWSLINFNFLEKLPIETEEFILDYTGLAFLKLPQGITSHQLELKDAFFQLALEFLAIKNGQNWNYKNPFVSFYTNISNRSLRVSLIHYSCVTSNSSKVFIRFLSSQIRSLEDFCDSSDLPILQMLVESKKNILISGATGSGKTSFLSSLLKNCKASEHLLIIEDTMEILCHSPNLTKLIATKQENKNMKDYLSYGMRMSPDRIIIGELRSEEVISFLLSLNTGHRGCLSTIHANSTLDAIDRLCLLFNLYSEKPLLNEYVKKLACNAIDYIVQLEDKKVVQLTRIINYHNGNLIHENIKNPMPYTAMPKM